MRAYATRAATVHVVLAPHMSRNAALNVWLSGMAYPENALWMSLAALAWYEYYERNQND